MFVMTLSPVFIRQKSQNEHEKQTNLNYQIVAAVDAC